MAPHTAKPVRSQNSSTYKGAISSSTRKTASTTSRTGDRRRGAAGPAAREAPRVFAATDSDTGQLLRPEQPGRPDEQHEDHDDVRDTVPEAAAEERELVRVAGRQRPGPTDRQA